MGIIERWKQRRDGKRMDRLEADLKMLKNKIQFNPLAAYMENAETEEVFSRKIAEYKTWSVGNGALLRRFYTSEATENSLNYFWRRAPVTARMVHAGVPGLISAKMPRILFSSGIRTDVSVFAEDGKENESAGKSAKELLDAILAEMKIGDKLTAAATAESWGGHCFLKLSHDLSLSPFPILETADITEAEVVKNRGVTVAVTFKTWYDKGSTGKKEKWRLDEEYGTNEKGDATITYRLFKLENGKEIRYPVGAIEETQDLLSVNMDENGTITFPGLKGLLAFEKPNKVPSMEFPHSDYGASDYEGALDSFDAVDEAFSKIFHEIRTNRTIRYIPSNLIPTTAGKGGSGSRKLNDDFTDAYVEVVGDPDQDAKNEIRFSQIPDKTEEHKQKYLVALSAALNKAGLSPYSIGITGLESVNASAESQQERNKVTIETRKAKLELWKPFLEKLYTQILAYNSWLKNVQHADQPGLPNVEVSPENMTVHVEFGDYVTETEKQRVEVWGMAKTQSVSSIETAVKALHPDWATEDVNKEVTLIRYESGMAADDPSTLPDLDGEEPLPDRLASKLREDANSGDETATDNGRVAEE